ncbi:MAG: cytochrome c [Solirubrobacterales bacterium]|nr:cytochrome c [Solirubrobacterales bacterium]
MLGTWLFVALWVLLGISVFFIAVRGGLGGARATFQQQSYGARRAAGIIFTIIYVAFGVAIPLVLLIGNRVNASAQVGGYRLTPAMKTGRQLFGQHCGVCHTLAGANSIGKVGPNLDVIKPSQSLVAHTIQYGCLQSPPPGNPNVSCLGYGTMPSEVLQGQQAADVAKFVAQVAGRE